MSGRFGAEHLRSSAQNRRSLPGKLGYSQVTERVDERALSSASTPVHHGAGKSPFSMASRQSMGQMPPSYAGAGQMPAPYPEDNLMSKVPRRYGHHVDHVNTPGKSPSQNRTAAARSQPVNPMSPSSYAGSALPSALAQRGQTPKGGIGNALGARVQTPTRDENETPNGKRGVLRPSSGMQEDNRRSSKFGEGGKAASPSTPLRSPGQTTSALQLGVSYPVIENRLYWASVRNEMPEAEGEHWFTTDRILIYAAFCADFGPMNLSSVYRFCKIMRDKMETKELKNKKIVCFTGATPQLRTNCVFLLGCYLCTELGMSPEQTWQIFNRFEPSPFLGYRDATFVRSTWDLHLIDCWRGLLKGVKTGLISLDSFNPEEYDYYDHPQHGDMHVIVPGKFIAFKGPTARRFRLAPGVYSHTPKDYVEVFRHHKVSAIVRLNNKEYDRQDFIKTGFNHYDLFFEDCTTPNEAIVKRFFDCIEKEKGLTAVHCLAGLGRTGTLIGLWMMKHYDFTAQEVIAYLRILRPGSIIGPQQQYLCAAADKIKAGTYIPSVDMDQGVVNSAQSAALAQEVKEGMLRRHLQRVPSSDRSPIVKQ